MGFNIQGPWHTAVGMIWRVLGLVVILGGVGVAIGWSEAGARAKPGAIELRFWNGFTGPDGRTMLRIVKRFNEQNPDVYITMQRTEWATYYNKLFVAALGNRGPEIFVIQAHFLSRFQRAGLLKPVDDMVADGRIPVDDIFANVWQIAQFDHHAVGLPLDMFILGQYYNKRMLEEAGVVDGEGRAKPPATRGEFVEMLEKVKRHNPEQYGYVFANYNTSVYAIMQQFGGKMFNEDYSRCTVDDPKNVEALEFCCDLVRRGLAPSPDVTNGWFAFQQGNVGSTWEGIYMLSDLMNTEHRENFAGAPIPLLGSEPATWAGSHVLCLRPDLTGKELAAAQRFILFLSDNSLDWAAGGQVPVRKHLEGSERFKGMAFQSAFAEQIPIVRYDPRIPYIFEFQTELSHAIEVALHGRMSARQALEEATATINGIMARDREMNPPGATGGGHE